MFWIILILFAGFGVGVLLKGRVKLPTGIITTVSICLLLFALGLEIGSNEELLHNLPSMGLTALVTAVLGIIGSALMVRAFAGLYSRLKVRDIRRMGGGEVNVGDASDGTGAAEVTEAAEVTDETGAACVGSCTDGTEGGVR